MNTTLTRLGLVLPLLLTAACASPRNLPDGRLIGEPIEVRESVAFAVVDADPTPYFEGIVLVEASVSAVCNSAGCWMQIEDDGHTALVRWESGCGGKYMFPSELSGHRVLVQGSFYPKQLSEDEVVHLEVEAGHPIEVDRDGYEFNASGILVLD